MSNLGLFLNFIMKALPIVFKDKGFDPESFAALIIFVLLVTGVFMLVGADATQFIVDVAKDLNDEIQ